MSPAGDRARVAHCDMGDRLWAQLAEMQAGLLSHRQLRELGVSRGEIRNHLRVGRWAVRSTQVVSTTTGPLSPQQALWLGVLHGGQSAMVGALSAAGVRGLERWERPEITILVGNPMSFEPLPGYRFFRTRRPYKVLLGSGELPVCRLEPAVLMFAAHEPHMRTALGAVAATVQQRLTTTPVLTAWIDRLSPLRRSRDLQELLADVGDGCTFHGRGRPARRRAAPTAYALRTPSAPKGQPRGSALYRCRVAAVRRPRAGPGGRRRVSRRSRTGNARPPAQPPPHVGEQVGRPVLGLGDQARTMGGHAGPRRPRRSPCRLSAQL